MSIKTLNLVTHASAALLPMMTRTGSIPHSVDRVLGAVVPLLLSSLGLQLLSYTLSDTPQSLAKLFWYLLPEGLTFGHTISPLIAPEILGIKTSLLSDIGLLAAGAIGSLRLFQIGTTGRDRTLDIPYTSLAQRAVCSVIGFAGLAQVADAIKNIAIGLFALQSLGPEQKYFVLKHRSLETLGGPLKSCRAVIIDGKSSEWGNWMDDHSHPLAEELYRKCEVRTYRGDPNATFPLCDAAEKGKKELGGPLDILALLGHANEDLIQLNKGTYLPGSSHQIACLKDHLQPDAQMILSGCNTATGNNSLAEKASRHLIGIEVVGFSAYSNPFYMTSSWEGKNLRLWSYRLRDSEGKWIFPWSNTARTFKNMPNNEPQCDQITDTGLQSLAGLRKLEKLDLT
jgi:hypothetical protein